MKRGIAISGLLLTVILCSSWGFLAHRTIHQLAVYELPPSMRYFFHRNMNEVVKRSVRADERRSEDKEEAPRHFIDLELYGDSAAWKMPRTWAAAVKKYGKDSLSHAGYLPYHVIAIKEKLTAAFRSGNKDSILFYATDLGHYISDAHVPLHTTENYDGQLTGQKGLHSLWESTIPEIDIRQYDLRSRHKARYLKHPDRVIWSTIRQSHKLLQDVFAAEKAATKAFTEKEKYRVQIRNGKEYKSYTAAFAKAYSARLGNTINKQLIRSANLVADFWYTSWVDAGCPNLNKGLLTPQRQQEREELRSEMEAFKKNKLIEKKLLIARQANDREE
ncbi:zinc dependent phospholipase C family protein [Longitalea luteola]|uniref:zinc dependent phospholipase C family protein n=1 Tax=Longitalea luteola TaxID=2812563 RepID=UPI001A965FB5|nr:zinc dependent phospholipase C family protein [Longitalea luteola]